MEILFCNDGLSKVVDLEYFKEIKIVDDLKISYSLFNLDLFEEGNYEKAIKWVPRSEEIRGVIYRGWMLSPPVYEKLHDVLLKEKNVLLFNSPTQYKFCHYFPECYEVIKDFTPLTIYKSLKEFDINSLKEYLQPFSTHPILIKDYVKSEKHYWDTACFCPDASDTDFVLASLENFKKLRNIEGGICFKEYVELETRGYDKILKRDAPVEYRIFFLYQKILSVSKYWDGCEYDGEIPLKDLENSIGKLIKSNFYSVDVAKKKDGKWVILEVGDGGVSGLPKDCDVKDFYKLLIKDMP